MQSPKTKILYLYSEIAGYLMPVFKRYVDKYKAEVTVIYWDQKKLTPYQPPQMDDVAFIKRSSFNKESLLDYCKQLKPDIVYVSGWMDKDYLNTTKYLKEQGIPIVTGFDDIWYGTLRQRLGAIAFPLLYKKYFTHAWVSGVYQFEFAKRLGFKNDQVIFDLLTANTLTFNVDIDNLESTSSEDGYFLFVGRLTNVKSIDTLVNAFKLYKEKYNGKWGLVCVGNGELQQMVESCEQITLIPFSDAEKLREIAKKAGVFVLPSRHEPWGVVVHEFVAMGLPLLLSERIGSKPTFFIEGFNGLLFKNDSAEELAITMNKFSSMDASDLNEMKKNSVMLSKRINVDTVAANFMSIINK